MSKSILLFAKSPKFDYESYHRIFSSLLSTTSINNSNIFNDGELSVPLLNGYEIMLRKPHSKQHYLSSIANLAYNDRYIENFAVFFKSTITFHVSF